MAGQPEFTLLLLGLGLKSFSMNSHSIPEIKRVIRSATMEQAKNVARQVMRLDTDRQILSFLFEETRKVIPGFSSGSGH
jgi:phosphotransferase system enzyme I (PtsI)